MLLRGYNKRQLCQCEFQNSQEMETLSTFHNNHPAEFRPELEKTERRVPVLLERCVERILTLYRHIKTAEQRTQQCGWYTGH